MLYHLLIYGWFDWTRSIIYLLSYTRCPVLGYLEVDEVNTQTNIFIDTTIHHPSSTEEEWGIGIGIGVLTKRRLRWLRNINNRNEAVVVVYKNSDQ